MSYKVIFSTRWADFDPNNHMRHSAYNDYAAEARARFFKHYGLTLTEFNQQNIGPVLFSENTKFFKEINISEDITVELFTRGLSTNGERFKFDHKIYRQDGLLAAEIEVFGAWLDLKKRKLTVPPKIIMDTIQHLEKTDNFIHIPLNKK